MKKLYFLGILHFCLGGVCWSQEGRRNFVNTERSQKIEIHNSGDTETSFSFSLNDKKFFRSTAEILTFIQSMEDEYPGESLPHKVWRFTVENRYHNVPLAEHCWYSSSPLLLFNSTGFGFCGDVAAVNKILWDEFGYQTRYWELGGIHVVSEVLNDGKWEMYDSDCEVYYLNNALEVASVEEIANDTSLISRPLTAKSASLMTERANIPEFALEYAASYAYSDLLKNAYHSPLKISSDDSEILNICRFINYTEPSGGYDDFFILPPGGTLTIGGKLTERLRTSPFNRDAEWDIQYYANISLRISGSWKGEIPFLPLILQDVKGDGIISLTRNDGVNTSHESFRIGSPELNFALSVFWSPYSRIEVEIFSDAEFFFLINPIFFSIEDRNHLFLHGQNIHQLQVKDFLELKEQGDDFNYSIYPNPMQERMVLAIYDINRSLGSGRASVELYNNNGQIIWSETLFLEDEFLNEFEVDTSILTSGLYFLRIRVGETIITEKVLKI